MKQIINACKKSLTGINALMIDLDGVVVHGNKLAPGSLHFFEFARKQQIKFVLLSNNSGWNAGTFIDKLTRLGIPEIKSHEVMALCDLTADYLTSNYKAGSRVFVIGREDLSRAIEERGFTISHSFEEGADIVVVGKDHSLTYDKLLNATLLIRSGAAFIGTNSDPSAPCERGIGPGNGAALSFLKTATGVLPTVLGKPEPELFNRAMMKLNHQAGETAVIGDRLNTDISGGQRVGLQTILVLCGVHKEKDIKRLDIHPDFVFQDLGHLADEWQKEINT
jgi:4-nitrophenyl phosphatase